MSMRLAAVLAAVLVPLIVLPGRAGTSNSLLDVSPDGGKLLVVHPDNDSRHFDLLLP